MDTDKVNSQPRGMVRSKLLQSELTEKIIGASMEVHRELGAGFLEKVYEVALARELAVRGVKCLHQAEVQVAYKGESVGMFVADLLVEGSVICEVKATKAIVPEHEAQLLNYLKATGIKVGLLLNFGARRFQFRRMVY